MASVCVGGEGVPTGTAQVHCQLAQADTGTEEKLLVDGLAGTHWDCTLVQPACSTQHCLAWLAPLKNRSFPPSQAVVCVSVSMCQFGGGGIISTNNINRHIVYVRR